MPLIVWPAVITLGITLLRLVGTLLGAFLVAVLKPKPTAG